eukprot:1160522-Pelagomonas_calceolata.AAC.2
MGMERCPGGCTSWYGTGPRWGSRRHQLGQDQTGACPGSHMPVHVQGGCSSAGSDDADVAELTPP